ncbi:MULTISPECIES: branched-chain amino acid ABC transporter permease [Rhodomicrobium]|uniref:branched-chain amino acid ABC transporter permease n=1 Tax=Rhodomicrobium TaxID=1068 RepID=UPI000B4B0721|nr:MULTISPECIES: branched-chain amino acid ABC transporter permease [Rhodomicrobium]
MSAKSNGSAATPVLYTVLLAVAIAAPFFVYPQFLMRGLCLALFASAFNLLLGYVGLLSFGHAAFFGFAAYVTGHLAKFGTVFLPYFTPFSTPRLHWLEIPMPPWTPELAILGGAFAATLLGLIIGGIAIRRQGIYFAMVTLALAQMLYFFCVQAPFTHGEDGIQAIPRGYLFGAIDMNNSLSMYYFVLAAFILCFLIIQRTIHSPFGQTLKAIRENEPRAISLGYNADRYKLLAFVISAGLAGVAGSLFALVFQIATLNNVHWHTSGEVVLMTLLGGMGTVLGPMVGAFLVAGIQQYLAAFGAWVSIFQGIIFVACVLLFRRGIVGEIQAFRRGGNKAEEEAPAPAVTSHSAAPSPAGE